MNKLSKYFLLIISIFFLFSIDAKAITFSKRTSGTKKVYINNNLYISDTKGNGYNSSTLIKLFHYDGSSTWRFAYCADRSKNYYSYSSYKEDKKYREKSKCSYKIKQGNKWIPKSGGDCSKIVGYIIAAAYDYAEENNKADWQKYGYAQTAIWTFLRDFAAESRLSVNNINSTNKWKENTILRTIIRNAWTNYYNEVALTDIEDAENDVEAPNLYSVDPTSGLHFSFIPSSVGENNDSCGAQSGYYETQEITIKNKQNQSLEFNITTNNSDVEIFYNGSSQGGEWNPVVQKNKKITFTLRVPGNKFIGSNVSDILTIYSELVTQNSGTISSTTYDSRRWARVADFDNSYSQGLIVLVTNTESDGYTNTTRKYKEVSLDATQDQMTFLVPDNPINKTENTGKCANNEGSASKFTQTRCETINFNDGTGGFVRIILTEAVEFQYGYLFSTKSINDGSPGSKIYAGGSFELNTNRNGENLATTYYKAAVKWTYADLKNGQPYYYKGNSSTELSETQLANKIFDSDKLKSNGSIQLPIYSKDSNNYKLIDERNVYTLQINPVSSGTQRETDNNGKIFYTTQFKDTVVKSLPYEIAVNGDVSYKVDEHDETLDVPRGYFVPMHYKEKKFPYNIAKSGNPAILNIIESSNNEQQFKYNATCEVDVVNPFDGDEDEGGKKYGGLRYRPIDVDNPFPKGNIPGNWSDGSGGYLHAGRISDTFNKSIIYNINMDDGVLNTIKGASGKYFEWSNMNESGKSDVINSYYKGNNSYCKIGEFSESCNN